MPGVSTHTRRDRAAPGAGPARDQQEPVARVCVEPDGQRGWFREQPLSREYHLLLLDARAANVHQEARVPNRATVSAVGVRELG